MELAEVKKYFENAEKCISTVGREFIMTEEIFDGIHKDEEDFYTSHGEFCLFDESKGFAKILTTKQPSFSITKDQIRQLTDPKVKEWFPEVFNLSKDFTGWVKTNFGGNEEYLVFFQEGILQYGFDGNGTWFDYGEYKAKISEDLFEATEEEVFEALKNEAVKRGYKKGNFECVCGWNDNEFDGFSICEDFKLVSAKKHRGGKVLFHKGNWATIIQTITKSEAEKLLNKKIID